MAHLFGRNKLREKAEAIPFGEVEQYIEIVRTWHRDYHHGTLKADKETSREQSYNRDFFMRILGYEEKPANPFTFEPKATTEKGQLPDAVISFNGENISAVVELKGASIPLDRPQQREGNMSPVQQAFKYKTQYRRCPFVIVSNFFEFRLYQDNQLDFESWTLDELVDPTNDYLNFRSWYVLLRAENFVAQEGTSKTEGLLSEVRIEQEEIGKRFYAEYKDARLTLLRELYKKYPHVREEIDFGIEKVQKIIDRIVFICFAEDRGLLPDNILHLVIESAKQSVFGGSLWNALKGFFEAVDKGSEKLEIPNGYNGGLFKADPELNALKISDEALRKVTGLSKYNFIEDLSVTILGHIFEQSISDLEEIKSKVNLDGTQKPTKQGRRKKDGIFYTPSYIVHYIVDNSLGAYLRENEERIKAEVGLKDGISDTTYAKREKQVYTQYQTFLQNVKILDPACGSGAFLVYVFDYLLAENQRVSAILGDLFGTEDYVRDILRNNIYGVDLNEESVEITKLSLWLKTAQKDKQLTALDENVKCGNSLIDDPEVAGRKAFDWQEQFPEVFEQGGFDAVVGNPPWVFARGGSFSESEKNYFYNRYNLANYQLNTYLLFVNLAHTLIKEQGRLGFIIPNTCLTIDSFEPFRKFLLEEVGQLSVINIFGQVFQDAAVDSCLILFAKDRPSKVLLGEMADGELEVVGRFPNTALAKSKYIINISMMKNKAIVDLMDKIESLSEPLSQVSTIKSGLVAYEVGKGNPAQTKQMKDDRVYHSTRKQGLDYLKYLDGRDVCRYTLNWGGQWLQYGANLAASRDERIFTSPRILVRQIPSKPPYCIQSQYVEKTILNDRNSNNVLDFKVDPHFVLAILNARLTSFWFINKFDKFQRGTFPQFKVKELALFPIPNASKEDRAELSNLAQQNCRQHEEFLQERQRFEKLAVAEFHLERFPNNASNWWEMDFADLVDALKVNLLLTQKDELLQLFNKYQPRLAELDAEIKSLDQQIDRMIYELYDLTPEEIAIVEGQS